MNLRPRLALVVLGLSLGCQMGNPAFDPGGEGETRGNAGSLDTQDSLGESNDSNSTGDGDPSTGDGDPSTGDGDPSTGDGDPSTGDGDPTTGDGDGDPAQCGDGNIDPNEECDDGNTNDGDGCSGNCTVESDPDSGDGDPDGGMIKLDMMLMESCPLTPDPVTCLECANNNCCFPKVQECFEHVQCMCVIQCLLAGEHSEQTCFQQICQPGNDDEVLIEAAFPCLDTFCPMQCAEG